MSSFRIFLSSAVFSYRAQFDWLNPLVWLTMKFVVSLSQMAFFVYIGIFTGAPVTFIAVGNALQSMSMSAFFSVINIADHDKSEGTLSFVLATPANRLALFTGRAVFRVLDGILAASISFMFAAFLFGVNFSQADLLALTVSIILTAFTMAGFGLLIGGLCFSLREPLAFANIFTTCLFIFCGVNFPVSSLPAAIQPVSYVFPLTYGLTATRNAIAGQGLNQIAPTLALQLLVGVVLMLIGYMFFRSFEHSARKTGKMEAV
jgi:ABC-2 type transport system permease protein